MNCLYCGNELSLLRELTDGEFCSREHRLRYKRLTKLALDRLINPESGDASVEAEPEAQPVPIVEISPAVPTPGFENPAGGLLALSGGSRIPLPQPIPANVGLLRHRGCRLPESLIPVPAWKPCFLEESPSFFPLPRLSPQPAAEMARIAPAQSHASVLSVSASNLAALILPPTTAPILTSAGRLEPSRFIPRAAQLPFVRDERSVCPLLHAIPSLAMPRLEVVAERSALTAPSPMAVAPQVAFAKAKPVSERPQEGRAAPVRRGRRQADRVLTETAPSQSGRPCLEPRALSMNAQPDLAACKPMPGAEWNFTPAAPHLAAAACPLPTNGVSLGAARLQTPFPSAASGVAARSREPQRLDFSVPGLRLLGLDTLAPRLALRRVDALKHELGGLDMAPFPVSGAETLAPMGNSMLPALASLFRYGRPVQKISPMPLVNEGLAAQDRPARPLAYATLPLRPPQPVVLNGNSLHIVETFEYVRPLDAPPIELVQSLVHLWRRAPAYVRYAAVAASVMLLLWAALPGSGVGGAVGSQWGRVQAGIRGRAAVELSEDFQDGMPDWEGTGEHAVEFAKWLESAYDYITIERPKLEKDMDNAYPPLRPMEEWFEPCDTDDKGKVTMLKMKDDGKTYEEKYGEVNRLEQLIQDKDLDILTQLVKYRHFFWA